MAKDFIKTWEGRRLEDWGSTVSREYKSFQRAMKSEVERIAREEGATLVEYHCGHYDQCGYLERDGFYVFFCYSNLDRCKVALKSNRSFYMRTVEGPKDCHGGHNHLISFEELRDTMRRLFSDQVRARVGQEGIMIREHTSSAGYRFTLAIMPFGLAVQVLAPDGPELYRNEMWPEVWTQTYDLYEGARRKMLDESSDIYAMLNNKAEALAKAA